MRRAEGAVAASRMVEVVCFGRSICLGKDWERGLTLEETVNDRVEVDVLRLVGHVEVKRSRSKRGKGAKAAIPRGRR